MSGSRQGKSERRIHTENIIITSINFTNLSDGLRMSCTYSVVENSGGLGKAVKQNATASFVVLDEDVKSSVAKLFDLAKSGIAEEVKV